MKKAALLLLQFIIFVSLGTFVSFGQVKTISSVTVTCTGRAEAGQVLSTIVVDTTGSGDGQINIRTGSSSARVAGCTLSLQKEGGRTLAVGDIIKATVTLESVDAEKYKFLGNYSSANVKVSGGTFVSATASGGKLKVVFTLSPVSGQLPAPEDPVWRASSAGTPKEPGAEDLSGKVTVKNIGKASWTAPAGKKGLYEVWLCRGESVVHKFTPVTAKNIDCYPYMTKKGVYYFKVRNVPADSAEKKYAMASEWAESDEFYLDEQHVSNGAGQEISSGTVGWVKTGNVWYYRYPDGTLQKNGWIKVNGNWYLFNKEGEMLTGKQSTQSGTYMLAPTGEMLTGWQKSGNNWYFFKNEAGAADEGVMLTKTWITEPDGKTYYLGDKGEMLTGWRQIGSSWYFFDASGVLARNTWINTFYVNADGAWVKNP